MNIRKLTLASIICFCISSTIKAQDDDIIVIPEIEPIQQISISDFPYTIKTNKPLIRIDEKCFMFDSIRLIKPFTFIDFLPPLFKKYQNSSYDDLYTIHKNTITENFFVLEADYIYNHNPDAQITRNDSCIEIRSEYLTRFSYMIVCIIKENDLDFFYLHNGPLDNLLDGNHLDFFTWRPLSMDPEFAKNFLDRCLEQKGISTIEPQTLRLSRKAMKKYKNKIEN